MRSRLAAWWRNLRCNSGLHTLADSSRGHPLRFYTHKCRHCGRDFES